MPILLIQSQRIRAKQSRKLQLVDLSNHRDANLPMEDSFDTGTKLHDTLQMWDLLQDETPGPTKEEPVD